MNNQEREAIIEILDLFLSVGVPAAIKGIKTFSGSDNPTPEEIRVLSETLKDPNEYWS